MNRPFLKALLVLALVFSGAVSPSTAMAGAACPGMPIGTPAVSAPMSCCGVGHCQCDMKSADRALDVALSDSSDHGVDVMSGGSSGSSLAAPIVAGQSAEKPYSSKTVPKPKLYDLQSTYRI